jgi:hypothetical protein
MVTQRNCSHPHLLELLEELLNKARTCAVEVLTVLYVPDRPQCRYLLFRIVIFGVYQDLISFGVSNYWSEVMRAELEIAV